MSLPAEYWFSPSLSTFMRHLSGFSSGVSLYAFCMLVLPMTSSTTSLSQILLSNSPLLPFSPFQETPLFSFHSPPKVYYFFHLNPLILWNLSKMDSPTLCGYTQIHLLSQNSSHTFFSLPTTTPFLHWLHVEIVCAKQALLFGHEPVRLPNLWHDV